MGKARYFYDTVTVVLLFLESMLVSNFIFAGMNIKDMTVPVYISMITLVLLIFYTISIIILGIRKSQKFSHGFAIFVGSIILFPILPLIYYLTYLRKLMGVPTPKEQMKKLLKELQQNPDLVS